jgi:hypothetical protein
VGGILQYSGQTGFLGNLEEMRLSTADGEDDADIWEVWITAIYAQFGEEAFTVSRLAEVMDSMYAGELREDAPKSLGDIEAPGDRSWLIRLGKALHDHVGQVFEVDGGTVKLTQKVDRHRRKKIYELTSVQSKRGE